MHPGHLQGDGKLRVPLGPARAPAGRLPDGGQVRPHRRGGRGPPGVEGGDAAGMTKY